MDGDDMSKPHAHVAFIARNPSSTNSQTHATRSSSSDSSSGNDEYERHHHYYSETDKRRESRPLRRHDDDDRNRRRRRGGRHKRAISRRRDTAAADDDSDMEEALGDDYTIPLSSESLREKQRRQPYAKATREQIARTVLLYILVFLIAGTSVVAVVFVFAGKHNDNYVMANIDARFASIQKAKTIENQCFKCVNYEQDPYKNGIAINRGERGVRTTIITSQMRLTEEAARHIHFEDGIQMPGVIFGDQVSGYSKSPNPPVIFTRGYLGYMSSAAGSLHVQGNRGYTSIAYVTSDVPRARRCEALVSAPAGVNGRVSEVPHYIVKSVSSGEYHYCLCLKQVRSSVAQPEYCVPLSHGVL